MHLQGLFFSNPVPCDFAVYAILGSRMKLSTMLAFKGVWVHLVACPK